MSQPKSLPYLPGQPILGHMTSMKGDVLGFLRRLVRDYQEAVHIKLAHIDVCFLFEPELVREVFVKRANEFEKSDLTVHLMRKTFGRGLVASTGDFHRKQRKLMQPVFHHQRIQSYGRLMAEYTERFIQNWHNGQQVDMQAEMMQLTMYIVGEALLGADMDNLSCEAPVVAEAIASNQYWLEKEFWLGFKLPFWLPLPSQRSLKQNNQRLRDVLRPLMAAHHAQDDKHEKDLLSLLMSAVDENGRPMDDELLMDEVVNLFSAGHETTSNALTWTFYLLAQHPEVMAKLQAEVDGVLADGRLPTTEDLTDLAYTEMVIKEAMRLYPPAWLLQFRQTLTATTIGGYAIKKGTMLVAAPYALHRNPIYFPEPERFEPERFVPERSANLPRYAYLPFGAGPHVCIGAQFAMMEAKLILAMIAQRFDVILAPNQVVEPEPLITMGPKDGLQVLLRERERPSLSQPSPQLAMNVAASGCPFHNVSA